SLKDIPEAKAVWRVLMSPSMGFGGMQAVPWDERERTSAEMLPEAYARVSTIAGVRAIPILPPPLPGAGEFDVELLLTSSDPPERMLPIAQQLVRAAFGSGKFLYADTDLKVDLPQTRIIIDRDRAAVMGLDPASVGRYLAVMHSRRYVNRFNCEGRSHRVSPPLADAARATPEDVLQMKVRAADDGLVSISS